LLKKQRIRKKYHCVPLPQIGIVTRDYKATNRGLAVYFCYQSSQNQINQKTAEPKSVK
jgi:hypothetical protein